MPIPQAVAHSNLPVVEVADKLILDILLTDEQARRLVLARLSDRVAVVAPGGMDALLARMLKLGHMPKVVDH